MSEEHGQIAELNRGQHGATLVGLGFSRYCRPLPLVLRPSYRLYYFSYGCHREAESGV